MTDLNSVGWQTNPLDCLIKVDLNQAFLTIQLLRRYGRCGTDRFFDCLAGDGQQLVANFSTADGLKIDSTPKTVISAAVLGMLNVLILPILKAVFFVPNLLTLRLLSGVFAFVVMNVIVFASAAKLVEGFSLRMGLWSAVLGAIALAVVSSFIKSALI
ncbi:MULTISPECIES: phage holin family protein [unclassified Microcoleus]|uniref:phage holin family protein n=1 Tax=unclassified Microcoleus TaxID=2642155 RepID=UPI002FD17D99